MKSSGTAIGWVLVTNVGASLKIDVGKIWVLVTIKYHTVSQMILDPFV